MAGKIIQTGRDLFAAKQAAGEPLVIDRFVLADITGINENDPINDAEALPASADIVFQGAVTASGYIDPEKVVYSLLLDSSIGDFSFNWVGIQADDGTLIAVDYVPSQTKIKTTGTTRGNNLSRNFLISYVDAQSITAINLPAATWQIDFTQRLKIIDDNERLSNYDIYGRACFIGDGFLIYDSAGTFKGRVGVAYVAGIRIDAIAEFDAEPVTLPMDVWLDVSLDQDVNGVKGKAVIVFNNATQNDYTDSLGNNHFLQRVATLTGSRAVIDRRNQLIPNLHLIDWFYHPDNKPTLQDLGFNGDANANVYTHPTQSPIILSTLAPEVLSGISVNNLGHVQSVNKKALTLGDLGFTGSLNANNYSHPTQSDINLTTSAAQVLSAINVNTAGHVQSVGLKTLLIGDLGGVSTSALSSALSGKMDNSEFVFSHGGSPISLSSITYPDGSREQMGTSLVSAQGSTVVTLPFAYTTAIENIQVSIRSNSTSHFENLHVLESGLGQIIIRNNMPSAYWIFWRVYGK
ncbi:MAG: phage tail protein [Cellvibrionaceae bacterium]